MMEYVIFLWGIIIKYDDGSVCGTLTLTLESIAGQQNASGIQYFCILRGDSPVVGHDEFNSTEVSGGAPYLGSFPISNTTPEHVSYRLEHFQVPPTSKPVTLSVSLLGVRVHTRENLLMSHSLRRVCSVIGRAHLRQVAYTAMEAAGQTYRRQCHVFQTEDIHQRNVYISVHIRNPFQLDPKNSFPLVNTSTRAQAINLCSPMGEDQVEEIESVLGNAFEAALVTRTSTPVRPVTMSTPLPAPIPSKSDKRTSSTAFMSRLLGKGKETFEEKSKRKRRPVSAVFSSAIHRLSSTASIANKR
ncbi:phosphotyrosine interaction domain protein, partial [Necator americanus]